MTATRRNLIELLCLGVFFVVLFRTEITLLHTPDDFHGWWLGNPMLRRAYGDAVRSGAHLFSVHVSGLLLVAWAFQKSRTWLAPSQQLPWLALHAGLALAASSTFLYLFLPTVRGWFHVLSMLIGVTGYAAVSLLALLIHKAWRRDVPLFTVFLPLLWGVTPLASVTLTEILQSTGLPLPEDAFFLPLIVSCMVILGAPYAIEKPFATPRPNDVFD